jgi:hypothetical protein
MQHAGSLLGAEESVRPRAHARGDGEEAQRAAMNDGLPGGGAAAEL